MLAAGCGVYTFSGSTLPSHLHTVDIPLFANRTLQPGIAEEISSELSSKVLGGNLLRVVPSGGDATLSGEVQTYANEEYQYDILKARTVDVQQYMVRITVYVEFIDNRKQSTRYKGILNGQGQYAIATEKEEDGRKRAVEDVVRQILEKSVQSW
jgi:hypothetical protein